MKNTDNRILWGIILLLHLASLVYQLKVQNWLLKDSYEYIFAAQNLLNESILYSGDLNEPERIDFYTKRPPAYPFILSLGFLMSGDILPTIILQHILSLVNIYLSLKLLTKLSSRGSHIPHHKPTHRTPLFTNPRYLFLFFLLLYPAQFIYANLIMTEILFQTLITGAVYCLFKAWDQPPLVWLWVFTGLIIISMLTKPVMYLFAIPHIFLIGYFFLQTKKWQLVLLALLPLLSVYGYQTWNEQRTGYFHFSSIQNLSLFQYTTYNLLVQEMGEEAATQYTDSVLYESLDQPTYRAEQKMISEFCIRTIRNHLGSYLKMHIKGMINFFIDPGRFDLFHFLNIEEQGKGLLKSFSSGGYTGVVKELSQLPFGIIIALVLVGIVNLIKLILCLIFTFDRHWDIRYRFSMLLFIVYLAGLTGTSGASRFGVPIGLILIVISMCEMSRLFRALTSRS